MDGARTGQDDKRRASNFFGLTTARDRLRHPPAVQGKTANLLGRTDQPHTFSYAADFGKLLATLAPRAGFGQIWFTPARTGYAKRIGQDMEAELGRPVKY